MTIKAENVENLDLETEISEAVPPIDEDQEVENPTEEEENEELEAEDNEDGTDPEENEEDEVVVSIGEDSPSQEDEVKKAPEWVRELRKSNRELKKKNRELEQQIQAASGAEFKPVELGKKPTLEDCDYDESKFDQALDQWYERKGKLEEQKALQKAEEEKQVKEWQQRLDTYQEQKDKLKVKDYEEAEELAQETLSNTQQGIIVQGADNPALVIYALGKNSKKMKEISQIKDPVKFSWAVSKLEATLKVTSRRKPPAPEQPVKGNASAGATDSTLEKLRAEAARTGDSTKLIAYKRKLRQR